MRWRRFWAAGMCAALATTGCDAFKSLRSVFHDEPEEGQLEELGDAGLRVEVTPPDGITVLLDGVRVSNLSPYVGENLKAGARTVEVRAMGYHTVSIPVELIDNEVLTLPVSLRKRDDGPAKAAPVEPPTKAKRVPKRPDPPEPPPPPTGPAPDLPSGVPQIALNIATTPQGPIHAIGARVRGRKVTIQKIWGTVQVAEVELGFRVGTAGLLTMRLPEDDAATWTRNGKPAKSGSTFRVNQGVVRLARDTGSGVRSILIRRQ